MIFLLKIYNRDACRNYRVLHIFTTMYHVQKKNESLDLSIYLIFQSDKDTSRESNLITIGREATGWGHLPTLASRRWRPTHRELSQEWL